MNKPTEQKTLSALGLCAKARKLIGGAAMICESLRGAKKLKDKCSFYGVPTVTLRATGTALADAVGKRGGHLSAVAVTDENLCRLIRSSLEQDRSEATDTQ